VVIPVPVQPNEARAELIAKYAAMCRAAGDNADLRRLDEWRMPNCADHFNLDSFASYLEENGDGLASLLNDPINSK